MHRSVTATLCTAAFVATAAGTAMSAQIAFVGPKAWNKVDTGQPSTDTARTFDQWKLSGQDPQTVTVIHDTTVTYDASLATMKDNFSKNGIKPTVDKDTTCQGRTGHVIEYTIGPDGHEYVTNRLLVSDGGSGVVTVTYSRAKSYDFDSDVKDAEDAFCKAS